MNVSVNATDYATVCATALASIDAGNALDTALPLTVQMEWLPFYPVKFFGNPKVSDLMNDRQQIRYLRLLAKGWHLDNPCFIPADVDFIARLCGCSPIEFQQDSAVVLSRFRLTKDSRFYYNTFLLREYLEAVPGYLGKRNAARETNRKRKEKRLSNATVDATAHATVNATEAQSVGHPHPPAPSNKTGDRGDRLEAARLLFIQLGVPGGRALIDAAAASIEILQGQTEMSVEAAATWLLGQMRDYQKLQRKPWSLLMFLQEAHWKDDPKTWERTNGQFQGSKGGDERTRDNFAKLSRIVARSTAEEMAGTANDEHAGNVLVGQAE